MKAKVTARGQVSIPSKIRKIFNIEPESSVEWIVDGNTIKIVPLPKDPVSAFKGRGSGKYSTKRLVDERRTERRKENGRDSGN